MDMLHADRFVMYSLFYSMLYKCTCNRSKCNLDFMLPHAQPSRSFTSPTDCIHQTPLFQFVVGLLYSMLRKWITANRSKWGL